jgi:hypothetical protein
MSASRMEAAQIGASTFAMSGGLSVSSVVRPHVHSVLGRLDARLAGGPWHPVHSAQ